MNIKNLEVTHNDLNIMREFIELYEDIQNTCNEYNKICASTRKKYNIKEKDLLQTLQNMISINILRRCKTTDEEYTILNQEYKELTTKYNSLLPYSKVIEINNELDTITLKDFTQKNVKIEEKKNLEEKYKESIKREKIEKNKKLTIRQTYVKIKYLYELYKLIYEYQNQTKVVEKIIIKRKIKQLLKQEIDIEFFETFYGIGE